MLHLEGDLLYLDRYWREEGQVVDDVLARSALPAPVVDAAVLDAGLERVFPLPGYDEQRAAARVALSHWTAVLTGGPGTGKTTAVAGLLALLAEQSPTAAADRARGSTGKAAARLEEAVRDETGSCRPRPGPARHALGADPAPAAGEPARDPHPLPPPPGQPPAPRRGRGRRVLDGLADDDGPADRGHPPDARLVFVGDPDQLARSRRAPCSPTWSMAWPPARGRTRATATNRRSRAPIRALAAAFRAIDRVR